MCGYRLLQHLGWCSEVFDTDWQRYYTPSLPPCPATLVLPPPTHQQGVFLSIEGVRVLEGNTRVYQKGFHELLLSVIILSVTPLLGISLSSCGELWCTVVAAARAYPQRDCPMPAWPQFPDPDPLPMDRPPGPSLAPGKCAMPGAEGAPWLGRQDRPLWEASREQSLSAMLPVQAERVTLLCAFPPAQGQWHLLALTSKLQLEKHPLESGSEGFSSGTHGNPHRPASKWMWGTQRAALRDTTELPALCLVTFRHATYGTTPVRCL